MKKIRFSLLTVLCLVLYLALVPEPVNAEEWIYTREDLPMVYDLMWDYLNLGAGDTIVFHFPASLVAELSQDKLVQTVRNAAYMVSTEDYWLSTRKHTDGHLEVKAVGLKIRSGEKLLIAFSSGDQSSLSSEEKQCLKQVTKVVTDMVRQYGEGSIDLEAAIYDYICEHVEYRTYPSGDNRREACTSATNAFMKGWGNCQAYSDLFRLMGHIGGLNVGYVIAASSSHMWNWIEIYPESGYHTFMVDVTFGDIENSRPHHYHMNFGLDRCDTHTWDKELFYGDLDKTTNDRYTYYSNKNSNFGYSADSVEEAAKYCVKRIENGHRYAEVLIKRTGIKYDDVHAALKSILKNRQAQWNISFLRQLDNYTVLMLTWKEYRNKTV